MEKLQKRVRKAIQEKWNEDVIDVKVEGGKVVNPFFLPKNNGLSFSYKQQAKGNIMVRYEKMIWFMFTGEGREYFGIWESRRCYGLP